MLVLVLEQAGGPCAISHCARSTRAQADEGFLYPLERAFFYINKPPMLLPHDDIEEIEFGRPDGNIAASTKTFDLIVRTRAPGSQARARFLLSQEYTATCPHASTVTKTTQDLT